MLGKFAPMYCLYFFEYCFLFLYTHAVFALVLVLVPADTYKLIPVGRRSKSWPNYADYPIESRSP